MKFSQLSSALIAASFFIQIASSSAQTSTQSTSTDKLAGTSWRLVRAIAEVQLPFTSVDAKLRAWLSPR